MPLNPTRPKPATLSPWTREVGLRSLSAPCVALRDWTRKKGADLGDGSDVKGANTWKAIDTPRFNGVLKAGTKSSVSDKIDSLDGDAASLFGLVG